MGLLSFIEAPIKDIIHGLEEPVEEITRIFGAVITITEDIIKELIALLGQIDNLFNASTFSSLFVKPFQNATMQAISGLQTLVSLIFSYGSEGFSDIGASLLTPMQDAYGLVKKGVADLKAEYIKLLNDFTPLPSNIIDDSSRELYAAVDKIDQGIDLIRADIAGMFNVVKAEGTSIAQDFEGFANTAVTSLSGDVNKVGAIAVDDLRDIETSVKNRLANESGAMDVFVFFIVGAIASAIIGLLFFTKSLLMLIAVVVVTAVVLLSYLFL